MGHKVHPVGFRIGVIRGWEAKWYADKHYREYLQEDLKLRKMIRSAYPEAGVSLVEIDRQANIITLTVHTARPGILIGRGVIGRCILGTLVAVQAGRFFPILDEALVMTILAGFILKKSILKISFTSLDRCMIFSLVIGKGN